MAKVILTLFHNEINYQNIVEIYEQSIKNLAIRLPIKIWMLLLTYNEVTESVDSLIWYFRIKPILKKEQSSTSNA